LFGSVWLHVLLFNLTTQMSLTYFAHSLYSVRFTYTLFALHGMKYGNNSSQRFTAIMQVSLL